MRLNLLRQRSFEPDMGLPWLLPEPAANTQGKQAGEPINGLFKFLN
jgi:hypothetical protein